MKEEIKRLRKEGKTYKEIVEEIGCAKSTVSYYCGKNQKEKSRRRQLKRRGNKPLLKKIEKFKNRGLSIKVSDFQRNRGKNGSFIGGRDYNFNYEDVVKHVGFNPHCYLTGRPLELYETKTYHFDHIIPVSKGGESKLSNLGVACKEANRAKDDLIVEDFLSLCKEILEHNGYKVVKQKMK